MSLGCPSLLCSSGLATPRLTKHTVALLCTTSSGSVLLWRIPTTTRRSTRTIKCDPPRTGVRVVLLAGPHAMIDLDRQEYISLRTAAKLVPSVRAPGSCIHISTVVRWAKRGVRGRKLATCMIGGTRCTTRADLDRFLAELNEGTPGVLVAPTRDPKRAHRTARILEREGLEVESPAGRSSIRRRIGRPSATSRRDASDQRLDHSA